MSTLAAVLVAVAGPPVTVLAAARVLDWCHRAVGLLGGGAR